MKNDQIAGFRRENKTYMWIFEILKIEKVKTYLSAVTRIGKMFEIKTTMNRKVGSGRPRPSAIKKRHTGLKVLF